MKDRRKKTDRRVSSMAEYRGEKNRRNRPDRRLNSIVVEWIPMESVHLHPSTRRIFQRS
jgi:hypothetical protein